MVIEEHIYVAAPTVEVWRLVADPGRMAGLSPELQRIEWLGTPNPEVGGTFRGYNRAGPVRWRTRNVIEWVEPARTFVWRTMDGPAYGFVTRWTYRLRRQDGGCEVTERFETVTWLSLVITRCCSGVDGGCSDVACALPYGLSRSLLNESRTTDDGYQAAAVLPGDPGPQGRI